jgi:Domain of unknown function (DUF4105)
VTYSPGQELYTAFGHSSIRVRDDGLGIDRLYNFGTFDFATPNFYLKFAKGDLLYQIAVTQAGPDMAGIGALGQGVTEVIVRLSQEQKQLLFEALEINLRPANRSYQYDFILDNCSTRVRDVFERVISGSIGADLGEPRTFRQMLDDYLGRTAWIRFGIYLLLGAPVDRPVRPREACFLPDGLELAIETATIRSQPLAEQKYRYYEPQPLPRTPTILRPEVLLTILGLVWFSCWIAGRRRTANWLTALLLVVIGATGVFLVGLSFWTRHWVAYENWNIAWLTPTHLLAGLWMLFQGRSTGPVLTWYCRAAAVWMVLFIPLSILLPQQFHPAIYPLILLVAWRCLAYSRFRRA